MNRLSKSLLVGLLEQENYITGFYGGGFKPPTKGHFAVVKKSLEQFPDIDKFYIVVGSGIRDGISQDESYSVWNIYKKYLGDKVEIVKADSSPLKYIKDYIKDNTDHKSFVFIGTRDDNDDDAQDFVKRKDFFENYGDHVDVKNIITKGGTSGTKAREASKISKEQFFQFLPSDLTDEEKNTIFNYVQTSIQEAAIKKITNKAKELGKNFTKAFKDQRGDFKGFGPLVIKYLRKQDLTPEEREKLKRNFSDILKTSGIALTFPVLGASGNVLLGWLTNKMTKGRFTTLPSKFKDKLLEEILLEIILKEENNLLLNENATYSSHIDYRQKIVDLTDYMREKGYTIDPLPKVEFKNGDEENAKNFFGKTAYYDPNSMTIVLYTEGRHPKDIVRSFSHEMIHHIQNLEDRLGDIQGTNTAEDDNLDKIEREAYLNGNITFRNWTDTLQEGFNPELGKDPFGINQFSRELIETPFINEGKYDYITNLVSSKIFNKWKSKFNPNKPIDEEQFIEYKFPVKYKNFNFDVESYIILDPGVDTFEILDTTGVGSDEKGDFMNVNFRIPTNTLPQGWEEISFMLKDVVRHEIEHLTHNIDSKSKIKSKELGDDLLVRKAIKAKLLPQKEYFKLEKEVDAMLQGMYFRAKKSKTPFKQVLSNYLDIQDITPEEKEEILKFWNKRAQQLSLPSTLDENLDPSQITVYLDMDGVLADFDERFRSLAKMSPDEFRDKYGMSKFWDFIDEEHKLRFWIGIPIMPGAKNLTDYVSKYHYEILTAPSVKKQSRLGKTLWVKNHADLFDRKPKINFKPAKEKHLIKPNLTSSDILIDDRMATINNWNDAGGTGIFYTSAQDAIKQLKELGL